MRTTDASIREVIERAIELARRYAVWRQLSSKATRAQNEAVINEHEDYFETTVQALFESFVVITYQLYDRRRDTISIHTLIDALATSNQMLSCKLASIVSRNKALLVKVSAIRCGVYAHRSKKHSPEAIFAASGITSREMKAIVGMTTCIVASLTAASGIDTEAEIVEEIGRRGICASDDAMLLMETLREHVL